MTSSNSLDKISLPSLPSNSTSLPSRPVVVSFASSPLGISLQSGKDGRNAMLVKMERFENNDYGLKVPLHSYVLQINDFVTINMLYNDILLLIKKSPFPIVMMFGCLSDSMIINIRTILCRGFQNLTK